MLCLPEIKKGLHTHRLPRGTRMRLALSFPWRSFESGSAGKFYMICNLTQQNVWEELNDEDIIGDPRNCRLCGKGPPFTIAQVEGQGLCWSSLAHIQKNLTKARSQELTKWLEAITQERENSRRGYYIPWRKAGINPTLGNAPKKYASRHYQLKVGHGAVGTFLV